MIYNDVATVLVSMHRVCPREGCNADIPVPTEIDFKAGDFQGMLRVSSVHTDLTKLDAHYVECY